MWVSGRIDAAAAAAVSILMRMRMPDENSADIDPHLVHDAVVVLLMMVADSRETPPHSDDYSADVSSGVDDDSDPGHWENLDSMKWMDWSTGSGDTGAGDMRMSNASRTMRNNVNPASCSPCLSW